MEGNPVHRVSAGDAWSSSMHPDIESERHSQSFNVEELTNILDGGAQNTALRRKVESIIHSEPELSLKDNYFMTQNERYEAAIKKKFHILMLAQRLGWSEGSSELQYASRSVSGDLGFAIHHIFQKTIRSLGSEEQIAKWDPLCSKFQILGTYAQTELGHGTYLQGLETEATYDAATQEFVVHSPTMTAIKWWPGDLGRSATHALVQAQLICSGARQGMHAFIVPIRSLDDHSPLPGITIGDIGPKMDFEHTDNGFLKLDHVRIPRENMLNRFAQVLPDGTYVKLGVPKSNYLSMVVVRVDILLGEVLPLLQKACTIAVRYAVIRRQSRLRPSDPEAKVLDYQTQQQKLFPPLAMAYAFHFVANNLLEFFHHSYSFILDGDFALLPELHALSAGLKAMLSDFCTQGVEQCRRACGGHGYSKLSGLPSLLTRVTASCTYEGENTVLYLQTARFLIKSYLNTQKSPGSASKGSLPQSVAYLTAPDLARCPAQTAADFLQPELYTTAWAHVAVRLIKDSVHHLQTLRQAGADEHDAWNQTTVIHVQATKAARPEDSRLRTGEPTRVLQQLPAAGRQERHLVAHHLHCMGGVGVILPPPFHSVHHRGAACCVQCTIGTGEGTPLLCHCEDFHRSSGETGKPASDSPDMARKAYLDLLPFIRKDAILLTDAFDFTDQCLNSALGCYDGHAYERLFQWAQKSPTNTEGNPAYEKYIRPLLQGRRARL
uniref:Acyl-coenzyme A oxidase n=1 Tax=Bos indicus x Bos taurus TaxID=30522 RepID=A0A4W2DJN9_BOBOX